MSRHFRLGVNYWPARTAMGWWRAFERSEVAADFLRIAASGFDSVRLFLTWEDFQPAPQRIDRRMVDQLVTTLELANDAGLLVIPTLFTGHMSGVNWIPAWALDGEAGDARFRVVSGGTLTKARLRNWYTDATTLRAQSALATELSDAVAGHAALWAWDLGNENSNCVIPPSKALARNWLRRISDAIRGADPSARITVGLHMEDLEQDRNLGPAEAADVCDFLTMHGYPGYAAWAEGPTDEQLLPFLAHLTRWLGGGADVLFAEFGVPTFRSGDTDDDRQRNGCATQLVEEREAARYVDRSLQALSQCGCMGAMIWCYADYVADLWQHPPLDLALHERSFGLWRADASPKPTVEVIEAFAEHHASSETRKVEWPEDSGWLDIEPEDLYGASGSQLPRLYRRYCESRSSG